MMLRPGQSNQRCTGQPLLCLAVGIWSLGVVLDHLPVRFAGRGHRLTKSERRKV